MKYIKRKSALMGLFVGLFWMMSLPVEAVCQKGTEITGKNGHVYCMSKIDMNWYTAFAWCDTQGRSLVTVEQLCDIDDTQTWDGNIGEGVCPNTVDITFPRELWTARPYGSNVFIARSKGILAIEHRGNGFRAICW